MKKFDILVADPPWNYDRKSTGGTNKSSSSQHYDTMTVDQLVELDELIHDLMKDEAVLFMWTTNSFIERALDIMASWGFRYKTMITWVKSNYGLGNWFRGKTEHLLFGVRGKVKPFYIQAPNLLYTTKGEKLGHSQKPQQSHSLIFECAKKLWMQDMSQEIHILELFARRVPNNLHPKIHYTCIGKEISGNDIIYDLNNIITKNNIQV